MTTRALLCFTLLSTTCLPLTALAQEVTSRTDPVALGTIQITATGTQEDDPAGTSPSATVTSAEIQKKQAATVARAISQVPGVSVARADDLLSSNFTIRNFGGNSALTSDPRVKFVLDGVDSSGGSFYRNTSGQIVDPALLKSVSVFKGPLASLEYGSGLVGGTVAAETINASDLTGDQPGVKVRQLLGASSNGGGWTTSTTLAWQPNESFDLLANYTRSYRDNQKDGNGDKIDLGGYNVPSYLLKARYRFGAAMDQSLTFSYNRSESAQRNVPFAQSSIISALGTINRDRKGHVASLTYAYAPENNPWVDFSLQYSQSRQQFDIEPVSGYSGSFAGEYSVDTDTLTAKNTATFVTGTVSHTLTAGAEISRQHRKEVMTQVSGDGKYVRQGIFAIDQMDFGNELTASAGARIERQRLYALRSNTEAPLADMGATARSAGLGVEKGLGYGVTGYGSFAYGEGLSPIDFAGSRPAIDPTYFGDKVFQSRTWETGLKYRGDDVFTGGDGLSGSIGLFQTAIWNDNTQAVGTTAVYYAQRKTSGIEAQATYQLDNGVYARLALTKTFSDNKRAPTTDWVFYEYALMDQGSVTVGRDWNGLDLSWTLRGGAGQDLGVVHQPGFGVSDLAVSYTVQDGALAGATINFGVDNVFDKQYQLQYTTTATSVTYPEAGRNFKLTLAKTF
ncbi:hypothetical protein D2T31_15055 [Sinirhodobacter populi]|uniref:TonB-dependent receptor n=1 Tax=Paenirhodobacter populi TaxID=2306993 RepID=A0A443K5R9_9RHOB|nr:TonB-dependent receptor [Sinirhodobacter populi]RWR28086.1 hypothetical protein D2T31_15055 [Sinirhodobacter populi]